MFIGLSTMPRRAGMYVGVVVQDLITYMRTSFL